MVVPTIIEKGSNGSMHYDIYSKLLKEGIILIDSVIEDTLAGLIVAQLLHLANEGPDDIKLYINSPGGSITAGLAIYDTMQTIQNDVSTVCVGRAASMGAVLLAGGAKGKRMALPNSEIMIHQPLIGGGGLEGQASDIEIHTRHLIKTRDKLYKILSEKTGKPVEQVLIDCDRDNYMDADEAVNYGLIDAVIKPASN